MISQGNFAPQTVTEAQQDKLAQVTQLLAEHFSGFVLVVASQDAAETQEIYDIRMLGGMAKGLGLLNLGQTQLYKTLHSSSPPPV